jgi:hypothetical protein
MHHSQRHQMLGLQGSNALIYSWDAIFELSIFEPGLAEAADRCSGYGSTCASWKLTAATWYASIIPALSSQSPSGAPDTLYGICSPDS